MATRLAPLLPVLAAVVIFFSLAAIHPRERARQTQRKRLMIRIDEIPSDEREAFKHNLNEIFKQISSLRTAAATVIHHSLVPKNNRTLCATVSIDTSLSKTDLTSRLSQFGIDHPYEYSCAFDGITPLYTCPSGAHVDIIAVPGLDSHPIVSFKSTSNNDVWLRDFLPRDVPNIRMLLYGYDTTLTESHSKQSIEDLGNTLLEQLVAYRAKDETSRRPIILIGHSLGGLLVKEAIVRARKKPNSANSELARAVYGLVLFGVPNHGLRNDQLRTLVDGQPNKQLVASLLVDKDSEPSNYLRKLSDGFAESCKGDYQVVSFFELQTSPTLELRDGLWQKTGPRSLLVTQDSATRMGLVAIPDEDNHGLNTDHSGLVKYDFRGQGDYSVVSNRLGRLVKEATPKIATRFAEHSVSQPQSKTEQACLRSLAFEDMDARFNEIDKATDGTCKWLLQHETLIQWTRHPRGLLCINGHSGSGKSTLLKYALYEVPACHGADTRHVSFFFHGRGHELQKTPLGLFRSILHGLLKLFPGALSDLVGHFEEKQKTEGEPGAKWNWDVQTLQSIFESSMVKVLENFPLMLFIDALDECDNQSAIDLIEYFEILLVKLPPTRSRLGICFSCRRFPPFELRYGTTLALDEANREDISLYLRSRFSRFSSSTDIEELISDSARGIFMWARLVADQVLPLMRDGEPHSEIKNEIRRVPPDLEKAQRITRRRRNLWNAYVSVRDH